MDDISGLFSMATSSESQISTQSASHHSSSKQRSSSTNERPFSFRFALSKPHGSKHENSHRSSSLNERPSSSTSVSSKPHSSKYGNNHCSSSSSDRPSSSKPHSSKHENSHHSSSSASILSKRHSSKHENSHRLSSLSERPSSSKPHSSKHENSHHSSSSVSTLSKPHGSKHENNHRSSSSNERLSSSKPHSSKHENSHHSSSSVSILSKSHSSKHENSHRSSSSSERPSSSKSHSSKHENNHRSSSSSERPSSSTSTLSKPHSLKYKNSHHSSSKSERPSSSTFTLSKQQSSKQHQCQPSHLSSSPASSKPPKPRSQCSSFSSHHPSSTKEYTRIEKKQIKLPSDVHEHELTRMPDGALFSCNGCKEEGCGRSYRCENRGCSYVLHEECANAILQRDKPAIHSFFEGEEFKFLETPTGRPWYCDACGMNVEGFVYHREATRSVTDFGLDLHPCCLNLTRTVSYKDSDGEKKTLTLHPNVRKKCAQCNKREVGDSTVKGWSYETSDGDCYHVSCFKEFFLQNLKEEYSSQEKVTAVSESHSNSNIEKNLKVIVKRRGGKSNSIGSVIMKVLAKTATTMVVKLLFLLILGGGHPIALLPTIGLIAHEAIAALT